MGLFITNEETALELSLRDLHTAYWQLFLPHMYVAVGRAKVHLEYIIPMTADIESQVKDSLIEFINIILNDASVVDILKPLTPEMF